MRAGEVSAISSCIRRALWLESRPTLRSLARRFLICLILFDDATMAALQSKADPGEIEEDQGDAWRRFMAKIPSR